MQGSAASGLTSYDYNPLGLQTNRTLTSAGGSSDRSMSWSFYPDGKLRSKSDDGVPVGKSVVLVDNSDTQHTASTGTWPTGNATGQQGYDHRTHAADTGTDAFTWTLNIPADGTYTAYVKYPKVTGAAPTAKYTLTHGTTTEPSVTKDQNADTGTWVSLGSYSLNQGEDTELKLDQNSAGVVVADGVKLVRDISADPADTEKKSFSYAYDVNGNLTSVDDTSSGAKIDAYTLTYTGLNQVQKVTEALAGEEKKATSYTYDANGQVETVTHPDQFSRYTYDLRELVKTVSVGKSASDPAPKVSSYTYTDRGQRLRETKANDNTVDYTYFLDGALKSTTEKKDSGTLVASHTYAYDANGNKAQDVAKKMNADDNSAYLSSTTDYTYDPVDRLTKSVKTGTGAGTETYDYDDNANVVSQTVKGTTTTFHYDRNRLQSASASGQTSSYNYDPFGRQESVTAGGKVIERSVYDGFDHVVESQKADDTGVLKSTKYAFDPLDRIASKASDGKTTDFTYLGLSSEVLNEEVSGALTKSYQYSPWGERLSQVKHNTDGTAEDGYYGYNSHTDVEALTDENGNTKSTYGYTAYGSDDEAEFTGIDTPDAGDPTKEAYNPYRFNSKRWDAQSGTYDMGFRDYDPGLNRFTTRDMYNGALADMSLGSDPYTSNRYAFTGGNPTSRIEYDGHDWWDTVTGFLGGATKTATKRSPAVSVFNVFKNVLGFTAARTEDERKSEVGARPDYSKGLVTTPVEQYEYDPYGDTTPANLSDCQTKKNTVIYYEPLDSQGRAQGVWACLNGADLNYKDDEGTLKYPDRKTKIVGSPAPWPLETPDDWDNRPKGWEPDSGMDRAHLFAREFGGSGTDRRNLVPLPSDVNQVSMAGWERAIKEELAKGKTVFYRIEASYQGNSTNPTLTGYAQVVYGEGMPWFHRSIDN